jgi:sigma-B regulation protein RsbU (phosphoserine phosphatase)
MRQLRPLDGSVSLSRRGLKAPWVRVTRSTRWTEDLNPWKEPHRLPLVSGGLFADLIYGDEPRLFDNLHVSADDPAAEYLSEFRSVAVIPLYDQGEALNMALLMRHEPGAFDPEDLPDLVSMSNLFGRATHNLVLMGQLKEAYEAADYELKVVADIQRSLLPRKPPQIPTMAIAAHYQTAHRAGGDYYDFFPLPDNKWGILVADVSGHGTPAAVLMAVTHSLAHTYQGPPTPPGEMLNHVNDHLTRLYTADSDTFVTAFYGVYNPADRTLTYASAGHNPPRLKRCADGSRPAVGHITARALPRTAPRPDAGRSVGLVHRRDHGSGRAERRAIRHGAVGSRAGGMFGDGLGLVAGGVGRGQRLHRRPASGRRPHLVGGEDIINTAQGLRGFLEWAK